MRRKLTKWDDYASAHRHVIHAVLVQVHVSSLALSHKAKLFSPRRPWRHKQVENPGADLTQNIRNSTVSPLESLPLFERSERRVDSGMEIDCRYFVEKWMWKGRLFAVDLCWLNDDIWPPTT